MAIDLQNARELLRKLDLNRLFVEELNWSNPSEGAVSLTVDDQKFTLKPVAEQADLGVFEVRDPGGDGIPDLAVRKKIHKLVSDRHKYEHILVFVNRPQTTTLWSWLRREDGKAPRPNEHRFHVDQPGDSLLQRLEGLAFDWDELDEDGRATIIQVTDKVREQFSRNAEQVTKKFYDEFQRQHDRFLKFITGIDELRDNEWYASVMLNRLMFIYFIQCKRFLDGDPAYLKNRLTCCQIEGVPFYRNFLVPLFFYGFATDKDERSEETRQLLGDIPYLNGGLFMPHEIERGGSEKDPTPETIAIDIPDEAFEQLFSFFDRYQWHLDDRPLRNDNEINPDVLGYIFEKYINQKQMGAYYTKEDITEYISRNTVLPFLFDKLRSQRWDAVVPLPIPDIEPYIFAAVRKGVDLDLPDYIAAGIDDVSRRGRWNEAADPEFALPTETWREHIHRRERVQRIREAFANGEITEINDFITHNLDIVAFTHDFLNDTDDPLLILNFYFNCLKQVTILDPTCGSGAFLFAALNLLEPLYEICLERMEEFLASRQRHRQWASDFERELADLKKHPSRNYFIYKSIIVNNLFGVDIMEEAVEICKLRLFLKLASQVDDPERIEPLPDIDFNILAGNTLVGYATYEQILEAKQPGASSSGQIDLSGIVDRVQKVDHKIKVFRGLQMQMDVDSRVLREQKENLNEDLEAVKLELNRDLAPEYHVKPAQLGDFIESHKPFHWYLEFNEILSRTPGGFDVVIGNPPYINRKEVLRDYGIRGYDTLEDGDIYAWILERSGQLLGPQGRTGFIVPLSLTFSRYFSRLRQHIASTYCLSWFSSYDNIPAALFSGVSQRCTIWIGGKRQQHQGVYVSEMRRWRSEYRPVLLSTLAFVPGYEPRDIVAEIPKLPSQELREVYARLKCRGASVSGTTPVERVTNCYKLRFSQAARNFISIFIEEPLCLDASSVRRCAATKIGDVSVRSADATEASLASCAGETYFMYWLIRGDGFDVTSWVIDDYLAVLSSVSPHHFETLVRLGGLLHARRHEALVFKKNAGKYVGNYNYWHLPELTRRADLVLMAGLGLDRAAAMAVLDHVQRVLSINVYAGEKSIPPEVRSLVPASDFDPQNQSRVFAEADSLIKEHYGFTDEELDFIINYDIKYRMGGADE
jgi:tRNA1(Val) A37 N6-methylase TrmN6/adenylate kinase family enzyme